MFRIISQFLEWWRAELRSFAPARLCVLFREAPNLVILHLQEEGLSLYHQQNGDLTGLGKITFAGASVAEQQAAVTRAFGIARGRPALAIALPAGQALSRCLTLPAAVTENLHQAVSFEMARRTPFSPEEVYFDAHVTGTLPESQEIEVDLTVVPHAAVDGMLARLIPLGLRPDRVWLAKDGPESKPIEVSLLPPGSAERPSRSIVAATGLVGAVAAALLLAAVYLPLEAKRLDAAKLGEQVAAARKEAGSAARLRDEIARLSQQGRLIADRKGMAPPATRIVSGLTALLPDDTHLFQLRIRDGKVEVQGYTPAAAGLIPLIESSPLFANATFKSGVTRNPKSGQERFHIGFDLARGGE